jgi:hypothetical protein
VAEIVRRTKDGSGVERDHVMETALGVLEAGFPLAEREREIRAVAAGSQADEIAAGNAIAVLRIRESERSAVLERIATAIHEWATQVYIAHRFRQQAAAIFERFRANCDAILASLCPDAISKLSHALERASSNNPEEWSAATLSCRRVLKAFADAVYPAQAEHVGGRNVDDEHYKNRLWAFAKLHVRRELEEAFLSEDEIDGLCTSLDRIYEMQGKGVHADISRDEADLAVIRTYTLLAQLAKLPRAAAVVAVKSR